MARVVFHEHPGEGGQCLPGAFRSYMDRIPLDGWGDLDQVWQHLRQTPYEEDRGQLAGGDKRCSPPQRSRVWPQTANCWEVTAHFSKAGEHFLGADWTIHVWDRDLRKQNGRMVRHCWPSLISPKGDHLLVDLETLAPHDYSGLLKSYGGVLAGDKNARAWQAQGKPVTLAPANFGWGDLAHDTGIGLQAAAPVLGVVAGFEGGPAAGQAVGQLATAGGNALAGTPAPSIQAPAPASIQAPAAPGSSAASLPPAPAAPAPAAGVVAQILAPPVTGSDRPSPTQDPAPDQDFDGLGVF